MVMILPGDQVRLETALDCIFLRPLNLNLNQIDQSWAKVTTSDVGMVIYYDENYMINRPHTGDDTICVFSHDGMSSMGWIDSAYLRKI